MRVCDLLWAPGFVLSDANPETQKIRALPSMEAQQPSGVPNKAVKDTDHLTHGDKLLSYKQLVRTSLAFPVYKARSSTLLYVISKSSL